MGKYGDILEFIPQRSPIVMIEDLLEASNESATTCLKIKDSNIFCKDGFFQEPGLIENIAQTAAAMTGWGAKMNNQDVKLGFIGAVKNLKIYKFPPVDSIINTTVTIENIVMNITIINGVVRLNDEIVAECEMRIFIEE